MLEFQIPEEFHDHFEEQGQRKTSEKPPVQIVYHRREAMVKGIL